MGSGIQNGLRNIVEDVTPQLGGNLDVNGFSIITTANGNIVLAPDGSGVVVLSGTNLQLEDTTAADIGVVTKGTDRFLHNFHHPTGGGAVPLGRNVFLGVDAGNFTMGATATSTSHGSDNVGIGDGACSDVVKGWGNLAIGFNSCGSITDGFANCSQGWSSLTSLTTGDYCVAIGYNAGRRVADASGNITTDRSIYIGKDTRASVDGADNEVVIGADAVGIGANIIVLGGPSHTAVALPNNNQKLFWGAVQDVSVAFDGDSLNIKLDEVGSNSLTVGDGGTTNYTSISATGDLTFVGSAGLPYGEISVKDNAVANTAGTTKTQFVLFDTDGESNNATPDHTNDHITIVKAGRYMVVASVAAQSDDAQSIELDLTCYKNNGATELPNVHAHRSFVGGVTTLGSISLSGIHNFAVDDTLELWIEAQADTRDVILSDVTLSVFQLGG